MQRIEQAAIYLHFLYAAPLQVIILGIIMYDIIGISCFPGLLFSILELPLYGNFSI